MVFIELLILIVIIVDVCNLGVVVFLIGYGLDVLLLSMSLGQGVQAEVVCGASPGSWRFVPRCQSCGSLQLDPRLERGFCLATVKPDFQKDRGLRFLCARVLPYPQITAQKEPKGRWDLGRPDPP